jgi:hypothetical protein
MHVNRLNEDIGIKVNIKPIDDLVLMEVNP